MYIVALLLLAGSCKSGFQRIDERVDRLISEASSSLGPDATPAVGSRQSAFSSWPTADGPKPKDGRQERPSTINPSAADLHFAPDEQSADVLSRLQRYSQPPADAIPVDLSFALSFATLNSREYKFAEEQYVLAALRLLIERHLWGPRFFDEVSALVSGAGDQGLYDTSLRLVNELRVTQRLPYGGEISARALARATQDLHRRVSGENVQNAELILQADIPLLRGAGSVAREDLIQAERNLIYAAREFEQFRRQFFFDISQDFLDLVLQQQAVENAVRQVERLREVEERERTLYEAGRTPYFSAALAAQSTVTALDNLNSRREFYRLAVDRFKLRLGMQVDQAVRIVPSTFNLPVPGVRNQRSELRNQRSEIRGQGSEVSDQLQASKTSSLQVFQSPAEGLLDQAVQAAMTYRLDLQTGRDVVDDARRQLENAANDLLPDLNLVGSYSLPTDRRKARSGLDFAGGAGDSTFTVGGTLSLPLDRDIERVNVRRAQIQLERARRAMELLRDDIAVSVRSAVREIDRARYTLEIQEQSIQIGEQRVASIEAAPDRATARDASEAANELLRALDRRDAAARDLQVAILRYLLETGQLRIDSQGNLLPLHGMPADAGQPQLLPANRMLPADSERPPPVLENLTPTPQATEH